MYIHPIIETDTRRILQLVDFSPLRGKRMLVTGGNGFIGQYLVYTLSMANRTQNLWCRVVSVSQHGAHKFLKRLLPN